MRTTKALAALSYAALLGAVSLCLLSRALAPRSTAGEGPVVTRLEPESLTPGVFEDLEVTASGSHFSPETRVETSVEGVLVGRVAFLSRERLRVELGLRDDADPEKRLSHGKSITLAFRTPLRDGRIETVEATLRVSRDYRPVGLEVTNFDASELVEVRRSFVLVGYALEGHAPFLVHAENLDTGKVFSQEPWRRDEQLGVPVIPGENQIVFSVTDATGRSSETFVRVFSRALPPNQALVAFQSSPPAYYGDPVQWPSFDHQPPNQEDCGDSCSTGNDESVLWTSPAPPTTGEGENCENPPTGNGVRPQDGRCAQEATDAVAEAAAGGRDFGMKRKYACGSQTDGILGRGWDFKWGSQFKLDDCSTPTAGMYSRGTYRRDRYTNVRQEANGDYVFDGIPKGYSDLRTAVEPANSIISQEKKNGYVQEFDACTGLLKNRRDRYGNTESVTYDQNGRISLITDNVGRTMWFQYWSDTDTVAPGRLSKISGPADQEVSYSYTNPDGYVRLAQASRKAETRIVEGTWQTVQSALTESYGYDSSGRLSTVTDSRGNVALENIFDTQGRVATQMIYGEEHTYVYNDETPEEIPANSGNWYTSVEHRRPVDLQVDTNKFTGVDFILGVATDRVDMSRLKSKGPQAPRYIQFPQDACYCECWCPAGVILPSGESSQIERNEDGHVTKIRRRKGKLTEPLEGNPPDDDENDIIYQGTYEGQLLKTKTDPDGHQTTIQYDANSNPTRIEYPTTDPLGTPQAHVETRQYNANGQIISRTFDPSPGLGLELEYVYHSTGPGVGMVKDVKVRFDTGATDFLTWSYEYNAIGGVTRITDPEGRDTSFQRDSDQVVTEVAYYDPSAANRITKRLYYNRNLSLAVVELDNRIEGAVQPNAVWTTRYTHNAANFVTTIEREIEEVGGAPVFQTTTFGYDAIFRVTQITDPDGRTVDYEYDEYYQLTRTLLAKGTPDEEVASLIEYDVDGKPTKVTRSFTNPGAAGPTSVVAVLEYNTFARLTKALDSDQPGANYTTYAYDKRGNVTQVERYDGADTLIARVQRGFDELGRLTSVTRGTGVGQTPATTTFAYDAASRLTGVTDHHGDSTTYGYDLANRLTRITYPTTGAATDADYVHYSYDIASNLTRIDRRDVNTYTEAAAATHTWRFGYDDLDRWRTTKYWGTDGEQAGDPLWQVLEYDSRGLAVLSEDENGIQSTAAYDGLGRLTGSTLNSGGTPSVGMAIGYDDAGHVTSRTDGLGRTASYSYDVKGRLTQTLLPGGDWRSVSYNEAGLPKTWSDSKGASGEYHYDPRGLLTRKAVTFGSGSLQTTEESFEYDAAYRLTRAVDDDTEVSFLYNGSGQLESETLTIQSYLPQTTDYSWDPTGRLTSLAYPVTGRTYGYLHDELDRLTKIQEPGSPAKDLVRYFYEGPGTKLVRKERGLDLASLPKMVTSFEWDHYDRNKRIHHQLDNGGLSTLRDLTYGWGDGQTGKFFERTSYDISTASSTTTQTFQYDDLYRLASATKDSSSWSYNYNAAQSRTSVSGPSSSTDYDLNSENQITTSYINDASGWITKSYAYDGAGNLTSKKRDDTGLGKTYTYNYRDQLVKVTDDDTGSSYPVTYELRYDALGRRVSEKRSDYSSSDETLFFYAGESILVETDIALSPKRETLFGPGVDTVEYSTTGSGNHSFPLQDALGSVVAVASDQGTIQTTFSYSAYGETTQTGSAFPYAFNGRRYLSELELYDYRNRWYDPEDGRFIHRDPLGIWGDGVGLGNGYAYVGNNPVNRIDPFGLCGGGDGGGGGGNGPQEPDDDTESEDTEEKSCEVGEEEEEEEEEWPLPSELPPVSEEEALELLEKYGPYEGPETTEELVEDLRRIISRPPPGSARELTRAGASGGLREGLKDLMASGRRVAGDIGEFFSDPRNALDAVGMSEVPGLSQGADLLSGVISLVEGDLTGAGLSLASTVPGLGQWSGAAKMARRASNVLDAGADCGKAAKKGPYSHLDDHPSVGPGKKFTQSQKKKILEENRSRNGGRLRDDRTGEDLVQPEQHRRGVRPPDNEAHVDHVDPRSRGGSNSFGNAEVRSRANNLRKGNR